MTTKLNKLLLAVVTFLMCSLPASGQTVINSIMTADETWTAANSPYVLTANALVTDSATLTILPGTKIRSTGNFKIIVNGEVIAVGKKDSVIIMDTMRFEFTKISVGHDFSNGSGSRFVYCFFTGPSMGGNQNITLQEKSMLISNCRFYDTYYTIYYTGGSYDTSLVRIEKSVFEGGSMGGYMLYASGGFNSFFEIDECIMKSMYGFFVPYNLVLTNSAFYDWKSTSGIKINNIHPSYSSNYRISCNVFKKFRRSIIEGYVFSNNADVEISYNTFDSADYHIELGISNGSGYNPSKFRVENNNFLRYNLNSVKFGGGGTPGVADTIDFRNNYWNSVNTSDINTGIRDFKDDITVAAVVDYGSYYTNLITSCNQQNNSGLKSAEKSFFDLYPNPASGIVNIESHTAGTKTIKMYNQIGALVYSGSFDDEIGSINVSELNSGVYVIEVTVNGTKRTLQKMVVNH